MKESQANPKDTAAGKKNPLRRALRRRRRSLNLRRAIRSSASGRFFLGYRDEELALTDPAAATRCRRRAEVHRLRVSRNAALCERSPLLRRLSRGIRALIATSGRRYALLFAPFGLAVLFRFLLLPLLADGYMLSRSGAWIGGLSLLLALLLLTLRAPIGEAFASDRVIGTLLFDFLGARRPAPTAEKPLSPVLLLFCGLLFAAIGVWVSPVLPAVLLALSLFLLLSAASPEFCLNATVLSFPFMVFLKRGTLLLLLLLAIAVLCTFRKLLLGKRSFRFEAVDLFLLLFSLFYLFGGLLAWDHSASAARGAVSAFALMGGGYFLTATLLSSRRVRMQFLAVLLTSASVLAAVGLYQEITDFVQPEWIDSPLARFLSAHIKEALGSPGVFAAYLILLIPLSLVLLWEPTKRRFDLRFVAPILLFAALVFTWSRGAWVGLFVGLLLLLLLATRRRVLLPVLLFVGLPNLLVFASPTLAEQIRTVFASVFGAGADATVAYRFGVWHGTLSLWREHLLTGIGVRGESFFTIYLPGALPGTASATHAYNLYLQIGLEMGLFALLAFALVLFYALCRCLGKRFRRAQGEARNLTVGALCGILAFLVFGITDHVFLNPRAFFLFWLVLGTLTACRRATEDEELRPLPEEDTSAAAAEIPIK